MYNEIPNIALNGYGVINKYEIINFVKKENNIDKIEQYVKHKKLILDQNPSYKTQEIIDILEESNYRINQLKGLDKLKEVVEETKKETHNLNNIEVIYTPYFINDKNKEGFRHDVTYIKIKDELYEVRNVNRVLAFLGNKEILKDMSEYEIKRFIQENSDLIKTNYIENDNRTKSEQVEEEIKRESDLHIRNALLAHKDDVVKEREKLDEYIDKNMPGARVIYGVNSNEERIYTVGDKLIKFEGKNRDLQIINELDVETMRRDFESKQGYDQEIDTNKFDDVNYFTDEIIENNVDNIVEKLYNEEKLTTEELAMLISFLKHYTDNPENVSALYKETVDKWFNNTSTGNELGKMSKELQEIYEKIRKYRIGKVPTYEFNGFIKTFIILESVLVLGLIIALVLLFK